MFCFLPLPDVYCVLCNSAQCTVTYVYIPIGGEFSSIALAERADQRFVWNHNLLREFQQQSNLSLYTLPIMCGFVSVKPVSMKGHNFTYVLISRRSVFRAGTR